MIARGLVRAVAASIFLHGAAAAVTVAWDRSRPDDADAAEGLSVIVDVVWLAAPEAAAASRPAGPTLVPRTASEAAIVTASAEVTVPVEVSETVLAPLERTADLVRGAREEAALAPGPAAEISAPDRQVLGPAATASPQASAHTPAAAGGASYLAAAAPSSRAAAHTPAAAVAASASTVEALKASRQQTAAVVVSAAGSGTTAVAGDAGPMWVPAGRGNARPNYPLLARRRGLEGRTLLSVEVLTSGESGAVAVISSSGHTVLDAAALAAVRRWKFVPAGDVALEAAAFIEVPVSFRLLD
jgi:protein TonB